MSTGRWKFPLLLVMLISCQRQSALPDLPALDDGTAGTVLRWVTGAAELYRECQSRNKRLGKTCLMRGQAGRCVKMARIATPSSPC